MFKLLLKKLPTLLVIALLSACNEEQDSTQYVHVGPNWAALHAIQPSSKTFDVQIEAKNTAVLGDTLELKVKSEQAGQLWIVQVDPNDEVSLIFPNALTPNNAIPAGQWMTVPAPGSHWSIEAMQPTGVSVIAFIVTSPNTDLNDVFNGQVNEMDKALRLVENAPAWGLAKQVIDIKE